MHLIPLPINAEPWAVGDAFAARGRGGKMYAKIAPDPQLVAYQEAVREAVSNWLTESGLTSEEIIGHNYDKVTFYIWRVQASYIRKDGRTQHRNRVDVTNIQKGTEDALQGLLFENDVNNVDVRTVMVDQVRQADVPDFQPWVVIKLEHSGLGLDDELPDNLFSMMADYVPSNQKVSLFSPTGSIYEPFGETDEF